MLFPGRLPNHKYFTVMLLPSDMTKAMVHQVYQEAADTQGYMSVNYTASSHSSGLTSAHTSV